MSPQHHGAGSMGGAQGFANHQQLRGGAGGDWRHDAWLWVLSAVTALLVWRTRIHLLWLLGAGAVLGALGLV